MQLIKKIGENSLLDWARLSFAVFFILLPFQINSLLYTSNIYGGGFFNPFSSFFFYLADIFLLFTLFILALHFLFGGKVQEFRIGERHVFYLLIALGFTYFLSIFMAVDGTVAFFYFLRFVEFFVVYLLVINQLIDLKTLVYLFIGVIFFASVVGILQYFFQHSLGLQFLGEPVISADLKGVAKVAIGEQTFLRSYGIFPHPNVFGGYLAFAIMFVLNYLDRKTRWFYVCLIVFGLALLFSLSRSAILALVIALPFYFLVSKVKFSWKTLLWIFLGGIMLVLFFDFAGILLARLGDTGSIVERLMYMDIAKQMFIDHPFGVGAGNFTLLMQEYTGFKLLPWLLQPVHNVFFLTLTELGIQGLIALIFLFSYSFFVTLNLLKKTRAKKKRQQMVFVLALGLIVFTIGLFDHYFVSLYSGQALLWIFLFFTGSQFVKKPLFR